MTHTTEEFRALGLAGFGHGWQSAMARALNVNTRTVRRWASGETPVPGRIWEALAKVTGAVDAQSRWPRQEWLGAFDNEDRTYLVHTLPPRIIGRVVETAGPNTDAPAETEGAADTSSGIVYEIDTETLLCEIVWIDSPPPGDQLQALLEAGAAAFTEIVG